MSFALFKRHGRPISTSHTYKCRSLLGVDKYSIVQEKLGDGGKKKSKTNVLIENGRCFQARELNIDK